MAIDISVPSDDLSPTPPRPIFEVWICRSPKAGDGSGREKVDVLIAALTAAGIAARSTESITELRSRFTEPNQPTQNIAVIAAGGDGTLALIADTVPAGVPVMPLPLGTENLLARHYGYTCDVNHVVDTLRAGCRIQVDAGRANGRLFLLMATAGFDAEVVRAMHLTRKGHIQRWQYARPIMRALRRYAFPEIHVRTMDVDGPGTAANSGNTIPQQVSIGAWAMVFNLPCYARSLGIEPDALGDDGELNLVLMKRGSIVSGIIYLTKILTKRHLQHPDFDRRLARLIRMTSPGRVPYQVDGDYAGHLPLQIEILPRHVTLLAPGPQNLWA